MTKLPKIIYIVLRYKGTKDEFLFAATDISQFYADELVGVYHQDELCKLNVTRVLRRIIKRRPNH